MDKLFRIVSNVSQPLGIAGIMAAAIFLISRQILQKNIFPTLTRNLSAAIITLIIKRLSTLALISMILGFLGFAIALAYRNPPPVSPPVRQFQDITFSGRVIDGKTGRIIRGAKIAVIASDQTLNDESDNNGVFVVRVHLPVDYLLINLKIEAAGYVPFFEHSISATTFKPVTLTRILTGKERKQPDNVNQDSNITSAERNVAGVEISYKPSDSQWANIANALNKAESRLPFNTTSIRAERIRGYWVINFEPISEPRGEIRLPQISTDQESNKMYETALRDACLRISIKWGDGTEIELDPNKNQNPDAIVVTKERITFTIRSPHLTLDSRKLHANPTVTIRGINELTDLRIRSIDPGVIFDETVQLDWKDVVNPTGQSGAKEYISGPHKLNVTLTSAPAAESECECGQCGNLICCPSPGNCVPCGDCGDVCCR